MTESNGETSTVVAILTCLSTGDRATASRMIKETGPEQAPGLMAELALAAYSFLDKFAQESIKRALVEGGADADDIHMLPKTEIQEMRLAVLQDIAASIVGP